MITMTPDFQNILNIIEVDLPSDQCPLYVVLLCQLAKKTKNRNIYSRAKFGQCNTSSTNIIVVSDTFG